MGTLLWPPGRLRGPKHSDWQGGLSFTGDMNHSPLDTGVRSVHRPSAEACPPTGLAAGPWRPGGLGSCLWRPRCPRGRARGNPERSPGAPAGPRDTALGFPPTAGARGVTSPWKHAHRGLSRPGRRWHDFGGTWRSLRVILGIFFRINHAFLETKRIISHKFWRLSRAGGGCRGRVFGKDL